MMDLCWDLSTDLIGRDDTYDWDQSRGFDGDLCENFTDDCLSGM